MTSDGTWVDPAAAAPEPPPASPVTGQDDPAAAVPPRRSRRPPVWGIAVAGAAVVAAVVAPLVVLGHRGASRDPRDVVLTAARLATGTSLRMDMTANETFSITGASSSALASLNGGTMTVRAALESQNHDQNRFQETVNAFGRSVDVTGVLYDGTLYLSQDGGTSYRTLPFSRSLSSQYSADNALQYLESVGTVTDTGAATVDGVAVEQYHALLDSAKMATVVKSLFSGLQSSALQKVANAMTFSGGFIDAGIDHSNHLVNETGAYDISVNAGLIDPSGAGTTMTVHATVTARFYDYGAAITVSRPTNVTGSINLP